MALARAAAGRHPDAPVWSGRGQSRARPRPMRRWSGRCGPGRTPFWCSSTCCRFLSATNRLAESLVACSMALSSDPWNGRCIPSAWGGFIWAASRTRRDLPAGRQLPHPTDVALDMALGRWMGKHFHRLWRGCRAVAGAFHRHHAGLGTLPCNWRPLISRPVASRTQRRPCRRGWHCVPGPCSRFRSRLHRGSGTSVAAGECPLLQELGGKPSRPKKSLQPDSGNHFLAREAPSTTRVKRSVDLTPLAK